MIVLDMVFFVALSTGVAMKYPCLLVFSRSLMIEWNDLMSTTADIEKHQTPVSPRHCAPVAIPFDWVQNNASHPLSSLGIPRFSRFARRPLCVAVLACLRSHVEHATVF
jgi:hypothetical protein